MKNTVTHIYVLGYAWKKYEKCTFLYNVLAKCDKNMKNTVTPIMFLVTCDSNKKNIGYCIMFWLCVTEIWKMWLLYNVLVICNSSIKSQFYLIKSQFLPNKITVLPNKITVLPNKITVLPNKITVLPNKITVLPNKITVLPNSLMHDNGTVNLTVNSKNENMIYCHVVLFHFFTKLEILMCSCTKFVDSSSPFLLVSRNVERAPLCRVYGVFSERQHFIPAE